MSDDLSIPIPDFRGSGRYGAGAPKGRARMDPDMRRMAFLAGGIAAILALLIGASALTTHRTRDVPVVHADPRPVRVKPDNPGGMKIDGADTDVFASGSDTRNARLAPAAEAPDTKALRDGAAPSVAQAAPAPAAQTAPTALAQAAPAAAQAVATPPAPAPAAPTPIAQPAPTKPAAMVAASPSAQPVAQPTVAPAPPAAMVAEAPPKPPAVALAPSPSAAKPAQAQPAPAPLTLALQQPSAVPPPVVAPPQPQAASPQPLAEAPKPQPAAKAAQPLPKQAAKPPAEEAPAPAKLAAATVPPPAAAKPAPAPAASAAPAAGSGPTVQLGAMLSEETARTEWATLVKHMPDLLTGRKPNFPTTVKDGTTYWRVRTGGFADVADARRFCERVKAKGGVCTVFGS